MHLFLISLDAASYPDADRLFSLPALCALKEKGTFCQNVQTVYPTITYPIHTSLLTGCYPDRHGIHHNQPFQPDTEPQMRKWYWELSDIRCKTLHEAAREAGADVASILWPVTGKNPCTRRNFPEILPLPGESAVKKMLTYASPLWLLKTELLYGKQRKSIRQPDLDDYALVLMKDLIASRKVPDLITLHLVDLDAMRHWHGVNSPEAHAAMQRLNDRLQAIVDCVKQRGIWDDTVFCIVSDHGHRDAPCGVMLDRHLKASRAGRAQSLGMGAYIFADDPEKAKAVLEEHREEWCIGHIYDEEELRALHAPQCVHLAVDAMDGCCFIDKEEETFGEHGFALHYPESKVFWLMSGAPVKSGHTLKSARVVDIAPTLSHLMQWSLPDPDGQVITDFFR